MPDEMVKCRACHGNGTVLTTAPGHAYECMGDCDRHGCPVPTDVVAQCERCYGTGVVTACCSLPPGHDHPPECSR